MKTFNGYKKQALTDVYALLAGGGHKPLSEFSMAHTHPYLPLSGGTVTGTLTLANSSVNKGTDTTELFRVYSSTGYKNGLSIFSIDNKTYINAKPYGSGTTNALYLRTYNSGAVDALILAANGNATFIGSVTASSFIGNASTATKLTSSAGSATLPIYFSDGKPVACTASSVFSNLSNSGNNLSVTVAGLNRTLTVGYATTSSMLKTSSWHGGAYTSSDTHYLCLGYMNCTPSYDSLTLLISSAFWGNQHGSQDIITILQDTNTNSTKIIQTTVGRLRLGGSVERTFYYYKDNTNLRLYLYVYVTGGNSYGKWNISYLGGNATWVNIWQTNVTKDTSWITIRYSAQVNYATLAGNATTATTLLTTRTLWGQSFNGSANISGTLSGVANILFNANNTYDIGSNSAASRYIYTYWLGSKSGLKLELGANNSNFGLGLCIDTNLNVGIGTNTPTCKLSVTGDIYTTTGFKKNGSSNSYVLLGGGGHKAISDFSTSGHNHDSSYVKYAKVAKSIADSANAKPYIYNIENEAVISGYYNYWYILNLGQYLGGNFGTLLAMPYQDSLADSELFIRSAKNGSWRTWRRILHDNNYTSYTVKKDGTGASGTWGINITGNAATATNADKVDGYHASSLWRSDGATWNPGANVSLNVSGNNQEWSFDIRRNGHTGCYWQVWDSSLNTMLKVNADNGKVYAPYNFVGNLEGSASSATIATKLASSGYANNALSYYQTDQAFDGSDTGWAHYIIANHHDGASYYHYTIRLPFWSVPQYRRLTGSTSNVTSWYNFITSENIGSQSVNYANLAGNADTTDGLHLYTRSLGVNGTSWTFASTANANSTTNIYAATSAGTSGQILKSTGGTPTWINQSDITAGYATYLNVQYCRDDSSPSNKGLWNTIKNGTTNAITNRVRFYTIYGTTTALGAPTDGFGELLEICSYNTNHWQPLLWFGSGKNGRLYYRNKSYNDNSWGSWRTVAWTSDIPTVTNYYWANIKVSASSSTSTSPTFSTCYTSNWFRSTGNTGWYNETYAGGWYMNDTTWIRTWNSKGIYTSSGTIYTAGHAWLATSSDYKVGIGTTSPSYKLHVAGDSYTSIWSRAGSGFYCEGTGVHFTRNSSATSAGEIDMTSNNEFCWGSSNGSLYFNYRGVSRGKTVTNYIWNAGSSSSYASHTLLSLTAKGHIYSQTSGNSWLDGQRYNNAAFNITNSPDRNSYSPWIRLTLEIGKWVSIGTLQNSLYFIGSTTSKTENSYDYGFRMDFSNGYLYGNFSGYLNGTASSATKLTSSAGSTTSPIYINNGFPEKCTFKYVSVSWLNSSAGSVYVYQYGPIVIILGKITKIGSLNTDAGVFSFSDSIGAPYDTIGFTVVQSNGSDRDRNTVLYCNLSSRTFKVAKGYSTCSPSSDYPFYFTCTFMTSSY